MAHILIVEDETSIADTLLYVLQNDGHTCTHLMLGQPALEHVRSLPTDLVVLDVGLPDLNGFEVCRQLRAFSDVPVIFLTARAEEVDRIVGIEIGADDYLTKPFSPRELAARIRGILRRRGSNKTEPKSENPIPENHKLAPDFELNEAGARIMYHRILLNLTRYEFLVLKALITQPGRIYSRSQLMDLVWVAPEHSLERTVDTHIKTLRAKLHTITPHRDPIVTHRGLGYSISGEEA